jgi:hypothetical protein
MGSARGVFLPAAVPLALLLLLPLFASHAAGSGVSVVGRDGDHEINDNTLLRNNHRHGHDDEGASDGDGDVEEWTGAVEAGAVSRSASSASSSSRRRVLSRPATTNNNVGGQKIKEQEQRNEHELFTFGANRHGELGLGHRRDAVKRPTPVSFLKVGGMYTLKAVETHRLQPRGLVTQPLEPIE